MIFDLYAREKLGSFFDRTTYPVPEGFFADRSYDEILESEMGREYEALS